MTAADAKRAFKQWCDMNGYVVRLYKKTRTKINVKVDSYETELNEDERAAFVEGAIHGIHALFEISVVPNVRVREVPTISKPILELE